MQRLISFITAAVLGIGVPLATAAPARADGPTPQLNGTFSHVCRPDGSADLTWTVTSTIPVTITGASYIPGNSTTEPSSLAGLVIPSPGALSFHQFLPFAEINAQVSIKWAIEGTDTIGQNAVARNLPSPCAKFAPHCDRTADVTLYPWFGDSESQALKYTINGEPARVQVGAAPTVIPDIQPGEDGRIVVTNGGITISNYRVEPPGNCPASPTAVAADPLPVTGSSLTVVIVAGAVLVIGGASVLVALFLLRRRRPDAVG